MFSSQQPTTPNHAGPNSLSDNVAGATGQETPPFNPPERQPTVAELIDAEFAKRDAEEADVALFDPDRKLKFRPGIMVDDKEWSDFQTTMTEELAVKPLDYILQTHFEEGQRLLIIPPVLPGVILDIQKRNGKYYKALLAEGGRFVGEPDNLLTKLTLLKFGFPVSGVTMQNILRMGSALREDDPPDELTDISTIQATEFTEKPLEFLDVYKERSHGWKIIRRRSPLQPLAKENEPEVGDRYSFGDGDGQDSADDESLSSETSAGSQSSFEESLEPEHSFRPHGNELHNPKFPYSVRPLGFVDGLRGGAGTSAATINPTDQGFIYSHYGGRARVSSDVASFVEKSLELLGIDPKSDWAFMVEQYNNQARYKHRPFNPRWNRGAGASSKITKKDQSTWETSILPRVINPRRDWMMAVRRISPYGGEPVPDYLHAAVNDGVGKPPKIPEIRGVRTADLSGVEDDPGSNASSQNHENIVQAFAAREPVNLDDGDSFVRDVLQRLELSPKTFEFSVDCYSRNSEETNAKIQDTIMFTNKSSRDLFNQEIASKKQATGKDWFFVARLINEKPDWKFVPPENRIAGVLHSYGGQLFVENTLGSIIEGAQQLLGFDPASDWSFCLDVHGEIVNTHRITCRNLSAIFKNVVQPLLIEGNQWPFLVRHDGTPTSSTLEPPDNLDVIYLHCAGKGIAYWKVPKDLTLEYGINQPQESFFAAMQILFPVGYSRPNKNVFIEGIDIGFGGMEVSPELWALVKNDTAEAINEGTRNYAAVPPGLQYQITLHDLVSDAENIIGIRLVGSHNFGHVATGLAGFHREILSEIIEMGYWLAHSKNPSQFRIWKTAEVREAREKGELLNYGLGKSEIQSLENWFNSAKGWTNCIQFRPEWSTFKLYELGGATESSQGWDAESDPKLSSFRTAVGKLLGNGVNLPTSSIVIFEAHSKKRFVLASNITEEEWRKHVYDWFSTSSLQVKLVQDIPYKLDTSTSWGLPRRAKVKRDNPQWTRARPEITANAIKFNRDRTNPSHTVGKKVTGGWNEFIGRQHELDNLQHGTYLFPQPVFEPGRKPDAPLFAESQELAIAVGIHTPTVYGQIHTLTEIQRLKTRERKLLNQVLERMVNCNICDLSFKAYENKEIISHYVHHQQEIASAGDCVLCGDKNWKFWSAEEKREHLHDHQARDEGAIATRFWAGFQCPGCDEDLSKLGDKDQILNHVISHDPLTVKFCDRCSKPYRYCTVEELAHHEQTCIEGLGNELNRVELIFCGQCGVEQTSMTKELRNDHQKSCGGPLARPDTFCVTCGFKTSNLTPVQQTRHDAECKPPGGIPRTYCKRCGINVADLAGDSIARHSQSCQTSIYNEPTILALANHKFQEINALISTNQRKEARRQKEISELREVQNALAADRALHKKELEEFQSLGSQHAKAQGHLSQLEQNKETSAQRTVESFKCPVIISVGGSLHSVCGQPLSLANGGADLITHYSQLHDTHRVLRPALGPNATRFKRMREELEKDTEDFDRFVKRLKRGKAIDNRFNRFEKEDEKKGDENNEDEGEEEEDEGGDNEEDKDNEDGDASSESSRSSNGLESEGSESEQDDQTTQSSKAGAPSTDGSNLAGRRGKKKGTKYYKGPKANDPAYKQPKNSRESSSSEDPVTPNKDSKVINELFSPEQGEKRAAGKTKGKGPSEKQKTTKESKAPPASDAPLTGNQSKKPIAKK